MYFQQVFVFFLVLVAACATTTEVKENEQDSRLEADNVLLPLPTPPLGITQQFSELAETPTPERVRLGRWLFFDRRLSKDGSISCATCHRSENAFSEPTPVSTGIAGQTGTRKSPAFINQAWTIYPHFFWDGRAKSLEEQAKGPIENPIEMGNTHAEVVRVIGGVKGYAKYFKQAFGDETVTIDRIAKAIADYERTRLSGNSAWDRWKNGDEKAVSDLVKLGDKIFSGKAACNQCHLGQNFSDSSFHNLGIGWNPKARSFSDKGRFIVTNKTEDLGAFKTPTLRDVTRHAPFMHDGSLKTLAEVVEHYNKGGTKNPQLSKKIFPLKLTKKEKQALVALMESLDGEGYQDKGPTVFPE